MPTPESLANVALYYLSRYAASEASLRQVLHNRLRRAALRDAAFADDRDRQQQLRAAIEAIIEKHRKSGALNDAAYAEAKVGSLRRSGRSLRDIKARLGRKGVAAEAIARALAQNSGDGDAGKAEFDAALKLAKRKRLGPFRAGSSDPARRRKDLAAFARAGFSLDIARKVLRGETGEEVGDEELEIREKRFSP